MTIKENSTASNLGQASNISGLPKDILRDFNEAVKSLAEARVLLERDITALKSELEELRKERDVLDVYIGKTKEVSDLIMAAKSAEEEKQDALKHNQGLKSYLDSAAETIKNLNLCLAERDNQIKRLNTVIETLQKENFSLLEERENFKFKISKMRDILEGRDLEIKTLMLKLEDSEGRRASLRGELELTKKTLNEIQASMISIKDKMVRGDLE